MGGRAVRGAAGGGVGGGGRASLACRRPSCAPHFFFFALRVGSPRTSAVRRLAAAPTGLDWPMTVSVPARTFAISSASAFLFLLFIRPDDEGGAGGGDTITTFRHSFPTAWRKQSAGELDRNNAKCKQTTASTCLCSLVQRPMAQQT